MELKNLSSGISPTSNKMEKKTLLLIDLSTNFSLVEKNKEYIYLNKGNINLINCRQIKLKNFMNLRKKVFANMIKEFKKFVLRNEESKHFLSEMEIFNLRNDRYEFPDRILNCLIIKKLILKKGFKKINIISDNKFTLKIFDNLDVNIEKKDLSKKTLKLNFPNLKIIKFLFKSMVITFYCKFLRLNKKNERQKKTFYLSLFPNKYLYGKENFFEKEENICNFLMSDETHLGFNLRKLFYFAKVTNDKNIINIEQYIYISDILLLLLKHLSYIFTLKKLKKIEIDIDGLDFKDELNNIYISSYVNRSKLEIYSKAIPRFLKKNKVSNFKLYLFEYSFGHYLIRSIKEFSSKIKISGYQHGLFSNNLMWFDLIKSLKFKKKYTPHDIYCLNRYCLKDYKLKYKNIKISIIRFKKDRKNFSFINGIKIKKKSNSILILSGLHDVRDLYFYAKNSLNPNYKKIFYFKHHPKNKFNFVSDKKVKEIENFEHKSFSKVIVSQNSSLPFEFLSLKRDFSVIDFDYKQNYISTHLNKNKNINFLKN
tara:strand:- start:7325 stop:8941 length:1617 start_codon:yes stop_codon:yes gene_type:complete